jgi:hypothetical protein
MKQIFGNSIVFEVQKLAQNEGKSIFSPDYENSINGEKIRPK